jgi:hypothetical protein
MEYFTPVHEIPVANRFSLNAKFVKSLKRINVDFGLNGLGEAVYRRTYSRRKINTDGLESQEEWADTISRSIEGAISIRKDHMIREGLDFDETVWQITAQKMTMAAHRMEWLPPGRGLWIGGTDFMYKNGASALNNCAFVTMKNPVYGMVWTMFQLMCGVGVGADTTADFKASIPEGTPVVYHIPDSREGWAQSLQNLMESYIVTGKPPVTMDYSLIRKKGEPLKGFGGKASGPPPLIELHNRVRAFFECYIAAQTVSPTDAILGMVWKTTTSKVSEFYIEGGFESKTVALAVDSMYVKINVIELAHGLPLSVNENCFTDDTLKTVYVLLKKKIDMAAKFERVSNFVNRLETKTLTQDDFKDFKDLSNVGYVENVLDITVKQMSDIDFTKLADVDMKYLIDYSSKTYGKTRLIADIFNSVGACVVAGNIRRSAEIFLGSVFDTEFLTLKNYDINPERAAIGWMSNNTVKMESHDDFLQAPVVASLMRRNGEPGIYNMCNVSKGRVGNTNPLGREAEEDKAIGLNPCGEIPLESGEFCNVSEVIWPRCKDTKTFENALKYATIYCSCVSLRMTGWVGTDEVVKRNRRIGVSITGVAQVYDKGGVKMVRRLRDGYTVVSNVNQQLAKEANVPEAIRKTTVKPSGTVSQLAGCTSGVHFATFQKAIRRVRFSDNSDMINDLKTAGYKIEADVYSSNTSVVEFPISYGDSSRAATDVSMYEQSTIGVEQFQRNWADNMVSQTIYFSKTEAPNLECFLASVLPNVKSISVLPHTEKGVWAQSPYEGITTAVYEELTNRINPVVYTKVKKMTDGECPKFCTSDKCEL